MSKSWQPHARHILDAIAKIQRIQARGDLTEDDVLYDAALRNLLAEAEIEEMDAVKVSERDFTRILELLENPPKPNAKLEAAIAALPNTL